MKKTGSQVITDILKRVNSSPELNGIKGDVYKAGQRPLNSLKEDIVINFLSGTVDQIQTGVVNVNVFVPNIKNGAGSTVCDTGRCRAIEEIMECWVDGIEDFDGYRLSLDEMIHTMPYEDGKQHFVNVRLKFDYITF